MRDHGSESEFVERLARPLRAPESLDPDFTARVMTAVRAERAPVISRAPGSPRLIQWWLRPRTLRLSLSPLAGAALAAGIALVAWVGATQRSGPPSGSPSQMVAVRHDTVHVVRFVLVAPTARHVALVGDFNDWDRTATRLRQTGSDGVWTASISLPPGRHQYAFIVDDTQWRVDPAATLSVDDEFGTTTSIISVGAGSS